MTNQTQPTPDLGQRLAVAFWDAMEKCGDDDRVHDMEYPWHDNPRIDGEIPYVLWDHMADALLSMPGIAIVELPKPSYVDEPEPDEKGYGYNGRSTRLGEHGVYAHNGLIYDQWDGWTPAEARTIASWWLAAAVKAEETE